MTEETQDAQAKQHSAVWRWWKELQTEDRAGRAELRRCATSAEAAFAAPYHRLLRRLGSRLGDADARRVAMLAAVLAHIEVDAALPTARLMGSAREGRDVSRVTDTRFRQILRGENPDELLRDLVRVIRQLDREANVDSLFQDLRQWNDTTRSRWARDYYEAAPLPKSSNA